MDIGGVDTWLQEIEVWRWLMGEVSGEETGTAGALCFNAVALLPLTKNF